MKALRRLRLVAACVLLALLLALALPEVQIRVAEGVALEQLGKPYVFGAEGPDSFDCSGLLKYAYARAGVELAHYTRTVAGDEHYRSIDDPSKLCRGDLVFFDTVGGSGIDHVGLWLGGGRFLHASSSAKQVTVSRFDERWRKRFVLAKRVVP